MVIKMTERIIKSTTIQKNINIKQLLFEILKRWYIILGGAIAFVVVTLLYTAFFVTPMYSSTAKIMIFNKTHSTSVNDMELSASTYLVRDFTEIISDKVVLADVAADLDNRYSTSQLKSYITVNNPINTRIIEINALCPNAEDSKKIVDSICTVSQEKIVELMGLDRINLISTGDVAKKPSTPNYSRNAFFSLTIGIIFSLAFILLLYFNDNKISTIEDIEDNVGLSVLATIPYNNKNKNNVKK